MVSRRRIVPQAVQMPLFQCATPIGGAGETPDTAPRPATPSGVSDPLNGYLLDGLMLEGPFDIPVLEPHLCSPERLVCFSEAMRMRAPDPSAWVHFYESDQQIARFRRSPKKYRQRLAGFGGIIEPDYSVYANMPTAQKISQTYSNRLLAAWAQNQGMNVVANVRLSGEDSISYALAGIPRGATVALGLHGCTKDRENRLEVMAEMHLIEAHLAPRNVLIYGSDAYGVTDWFREHDIEVDLYRPDTWTRSADRKAS